MRMRLQETADGLALVIPREMLAACQIGEEADVSIDGGTLRVRAPGWKPRQGWNEAIAQAETSATDKEDEETLTYWSELPEAPERPEVEPRGARQEALTGPG